MKNIKALPLALLLGVGSVSLPVSAADQPATPVPTNADANQATLKNIEKHLEYLAADVRFKNYLSVGFMGFSFVVTLMAAAAAGSSSPRR
jgi:hypothetical protein